MMHGIEIGKDVILKNMPPGEQMAMPKGIAGVVPWDPTPTMIVEERKNGRIIDSSYPYNIYEGNFYVRSGAGRQRARRGPGLSDAFVEATLWTRLNPEKAADLMAEDPNLKNFSKATPAAADQGLQHRCTSRPTCIRTAEFWGEANEPIFKWLLSSRSASRARSKAKDFAQAVDARFMEKTFAKLGWAVPKQPPFLPAGLEGRPLDKLPYPEYSTPINTKTPQAVPGEGRPGQGLDLRRQDLQALSAAVRCCPCVRRAIAAASA